MASNENGTVVVFVPRCSRIDASQATVAGAEAFDPTTMAYWMDQLVNMIPGFVLGGICACGFILMTIWVCVRCCRRRKLAAGSEPAVDQFLTDGGLSLAPPFSVSRLKHARRKRAADILAALMLLAAVATVGLAAWGLGETLVQTNSTISDFWIIVKGMYTQIVAGKLYLENLSYSLVLMAPSVDVLTSKIQELEPLLTNAGLSQDDVDRVLTLSEVAPGDTLITAAQKINDSAVPVLQDVVELFDSVLEWEAPTMTIQDTWRYVVLAVLYGLLIITVVGATALCFYMRFGRSASLTVALAWLLTMLVMLGGVSILYETSAVAADGCLYAESYAYDLADTLSNPTAKKLANGILNYYFNVTNVTTTLGDVLSKGQGKLGASENAAVLEVLSSVDLKDLLDALDAVQDVSEKMSSLAQGDKLEQLGEEYGISEEVVSSVQSLLLGTSGVLNSTTQLVHVLRRASVTPTYHEFKTYICCAVNDTAYWGWVSWTAAGAAALAFCLLASVRVVWQTVYPSDRGWAVSRSKAAFANLDDNVGINKWLDVQKGTKKVLSTESSENHSERIMVHAGPTAMESESFSVD